MLQSPFGPLSSSALAEAPAPSPASSSPTSWVFLCRGACGEAEGVGATSASCVSAGGLGGAGALWGAGGGGGGATATSGREDVFPHPAVVDPADPEAGINMAWTF